MNSHLLRKRNSGNFKCRNKKIIEEHVTSEYNHLWHLFTWGNVSCLEENDARKAFDNLEYTEAIKFYGGYSNHIENISVVAKISANRVDKDEDILQQI